MIYRVMSRHCGQNKQFPMHLAYVCQCSQYFPHIIKVSFTLLQNSTLLFMSFSRRRFFLFPPNVSTIRFSFFWPKCLNYTHLGLYLEMVGGLRKVCVFTQILISTRNVKFLSQKYDRSIRKGTSGKSSLVHGPKFLCAGISLWEIVLREFTLCEVWFGLINKQPLIHSGTE